MVWGLAWRCCIRRWVKKYSSSAAKLTGVVMADPPSGARAGASPRASAPVSRLNTTGYQPHAHGRGRRTKGATCAPDPGWTDTSARVFSWRIGVSGHADAGHGCRRGHADRSAGTVHKTFDECPRHPTGGRSWRRTNAGKLVAVSSGGCGGGWDLRGPHTVRD